MVDSFVKEFGGNDSKPPVPKASEVIPKPADAPSVQNKSTVPAKTKALQLNGDRDSVSMNDGVVSDDESEDKSIMDSLKYAENKLGKKMDTPNKVK